MLIGNTAEAILDQIECSVLAFKTGDAKTPVSLEH
jgi:nucleotide-binding universal stress UspA family protein